MAKRRPGIITMGIPKARSLFLFHKSFFFFFILPLYRECFCVKSSLPRHHFGFLSSLNKFLFFNPAFAQYRQECPFFQVFQMDGNNCTCLVYRMFHGQMTSDLMMRYKSEFLKFFYHITRSIARQLRHMQREEKGSIYLSLRQNLYQKELIHRLLRGFRGTIRSPL